MEKTSRERLGYAPWLLAMGLATTVAFCAFLALLLVVPIGNYYQATGTVRFLGEQALVSDIEGVVTGVLCEDMARIRRGQGILKVEDDQKAVGAKALELRIALLARQTEQLERLGANGALDAVPVDAKRLELEQAKAELAQFRKVLVPAARGGYFHFLTPPAEMLGTYLRKGDVVGYQYLGQEKEVEVILPSTWADRFDPGMAVRVYYRNPVSYFSRNVPAGIAALHANVADGRFQVICRLLVPADSMAMFRAGTQVKVSFLVNSTSVFQEIFGSDPYGDFLERYRVWKAAREVAGR